MGSVHQKAPPSCSSWWRHCRSVGLVVRSSPSASESSSIVWAMGALRQPDLAEGHSEEDDRGRLLLWAAVRPSVLASFTKIILATRKLPSSTLAEAILHLQTAAAVTYLATRKGAPHASRHSILPPRRLMAVLIAVGIRAAASGCGTTPGVRYEPHPSTKRPKPRAHADHRS